MSSAFKTVGSPEELGLSSQVIRQFLPRFRALGLHSLSLVQSGRAWAFAQKPFQVDSPHTLFSLSKSFCSMAAGMAVDEGLLSYEDSVAEMLQDSLPDQHDPRLGQVTLHHLLSMSSGLDEESDQQTRASQDWARAALGFRVKRKPGSHFHYNTMGTYLAGRMVSARTGMSLRDYMLPRLFEPLGIQKPQWDCCPMGYNVAGFGLHLSVLDLARVAQLLQNQGLWAGRRLLSQDYLARATRKQVDNYDPQEEHPHPDWMSGYGYQFWMGQHNRYRGDGMYGQVMMMDRASGLSLCCTAGLDLMGDQMDALHQLMDRLIASGKAGREAQASLARQVDRLTAAWPRDEGGPLDIEGSYLQENGKSLRLETPDQNTLRLLFRVPDQPFPLIFTLGRKQPYKGHFQPFAMGERPQRYLGRFGVREGKVTALVIMPEAPYTLRAQIKKTPEGLELTMDGVGFDKGNFTLRRTGA